MSTNQHTIEKQLVLSLLELTVDTKNLYGKHNLFNFFCKEKSLLKILLTSLNHWLLPKIINCMNANLIHDKNPKLELNMHSSQANIQVLICKKITIMVMEDF